MKLLLNQTMKLLLTLALAGAAAGLSAANWPLTETGGQKLANSGTEPGLSGYLGISSKADELDAKMTGYEGILCDGKTTATIPDNPFFSFSDAEGFTLSIEVKPLEELSEARRSRYQILTKGADSRQGGWQLRIRNQKTFGHFYLEFFMFPPGRGKAGTMFNVSIPIISQEWMKITVTMDRKECRIYVNDTEQGKFPCRELPPFCSEPIRIGIYSRGGRFGFPAQFRNLVIERRAVTPASASGKKYQTLR